MTLSWRPPSYWIGSFRDHDYLANDSIADIFNEQEFYSFMTLYFRSLHSCTWSTLDTAVAIKLDLYSTVQTLRSFRRRSAKHWPTWSHQPEAMAATSMLRSRLDVVQDLRRFLGCHISSSGNDQKAFLAAALVVMTTTISWFLFVRLATSSTAKTPKTKAGVLERRLMPY